MDIPVSIGVDIGGTKCLGVAIDEGQVIATEQRPTQREFADLVAVVDEMVTALDPIARDRGSTGAGPPSVGVGLPGLIDRDGRMHATAHLADPNASGPVEARRLLEERLQRPVLVDNDATCAALAELRLGAARGVSNMILITLGSGIGGAVVLDGQIRRGQHGFAGEFGHMLVDPDGPPCPCGQRGCWERYASGQGLRALASAAAEAGRLETLREAAGGDPRAVTGEAVETAARQGDAGALTVLDEFADWIAVGLSNLTNAYDPGAFVLGGGLAGTEDLLGGPIRRHLGERLYSSELRPHPDLLFAALGRSAGAIGAALLTADLADERR